MKLTSQLMKLDMTIDSFSRKEDKLVVTALGGKEGTLENIVTVSADEVIPVVGKIFNRHVLLYVLLFPFFLIKKNLGQQDIQDRMFTLGLVVSLLFSSFLLWMGRDYLATYPFIAGATLFCFSLFSFIAAYMSCKKSFTYLGVFILSLSYFCMVFKGVGTSALFPLFSIPLVALLAFGSELLKERGTVKVEIEVGKKKKKKEIVEHNVFSPTLSNGAMLVTVYFIWSILWNRGAFVEQFPLYAIVPLFAYALFFLYRYLVEKRVRWQYCMLLLVAFAYLLTLFTITSLEPPYYGPFLIGLGFVMMLAGDRLHPRLGIDQVSGFLVVGCFVSLASFLYALLAYDAFLISLFLFSASLFTTHRLLELKTPSKKSRKDPDPAEASYTATFFPLAHGAAYLALFAVLIEWFPVESGVIISMLGLSLCYLKVAYERKETFLTIRNYYIYPFGIFFAIFYFTGVAKLDPFHNTGLNMFLALPLLVSVLYLSFLNQQKGYGPLSDSLLDVSFFVVVVAFILPLLNGQHTLLPTSILAVAMGTIYLVFYPLIQKEEMWYFLPIVFSLLYYNLLVSLGVPHSLMGILYVPPGVMAIAGALIRYRSSLSFYNPFFFATFFLSGVSVTISFYVFELHPVVNIYNVILWTALYLVAATFAKKKTLGEEAATHA